MYGCPHVEYMIPSFKVGVRDLFEVTRGQPLRPCQFGVSKRLTLRDAISYMWVITSIVQKTPFVYCGGKMSFEVIFRTSGV